MLQLSFRDLTNYKPFRVLKYVFLSIKFIENHQEKISSWLCRWDKRYNVAGTIEKTLNKWIKKYNIPFHIGIISEDVEKSRFAWGVRSLPWLILTDKQHVVTAEGFRLSGLDAKIKEINADK